MKNTKRATSRKTASTTVAGDKPKSDVYQMVTDRIVAALEAGTVPWRQTWDARKSTHGPRNAVTGNAYRGINVWLLDISAMSAGYTDPRWLSYKQAADLGGNVRKGEHSTMVVFWKIGRVAAESTDANGETSTTERKTFMLRYYNVFNVAQCDGLKLKPLTASLHDHEPIELAQMIIDGMPNRPTMTFGNARAYYVPALDIVNMPAIGAFSDPAEFYGTAFHELSHATGHESRLNRHGMETGIAAFGSEVYGREELAAEFGAALLCGVAGISAPVIENQASYVASWLRTIKGDHKMVVVAASQGQKAADFIIGDTLGEDTEGED